MSARKLKTLEENKTKRIGLYVRVSTVEQASNPEGSIKSQEQRLRQHIEFRNSDLAFGTVHKVFIDRAKSGKDTNRSELQRLLKSVRSGEINLVMVTELSRLSRSIKDFSDIWEMMREYGCGFLSLRENFDTTTAAGELVLYSVANLAQYERRQTSERIAANIQARAERGLYNGGPLAFGYQLIPEKRGYLKIDEDAAKTVQECFKTFLIEGTLAKAGKSLNERGFKLNKRLVGGGAKPRLGYFTNGNLHEILTRITYIGKKKIKKNGEEILVDAVWEPIINEDIFYKVQDTLKKNRTIKTSANPKRYPYLLSTLTSCGVCGDRLTGKSAHGRNGKVAYYEHGWATKKQSCKVKKVFTCKNYMRFQAKLLEPAVWAEVLKLINDGSFAQRILDKANELYKNSSQKSEIDKVTEKIKVLEKQLEALAEHLTKLPRGLDPKPIFGQMQKIEIEKKELEKHIDANTINEDYKKPIALKDYESFLTNISKLLEKNSSPDLKRKVCERLIHKIELMPKGFKIHFYTGSEAFSGPNSLGVSSNAGPDLELIKNNRKRLENTKKNGSNSLQNGGRGAQLSTPPLKFNVPHDIIKFFPKSQERIFEVSAPLYESGYTLREIESKTGFAKSSIRQALTASGLTLRVGNRKPTTKAKRAIQASSPVQRYGYARLEGQLVKDPKEYRNVLQILKLWQSGKSLTAIANHLNDRKVPPRRGLRWHHETVHQIVKHETQNKEK